MSDLIGWIRRSNHTARASWLHSLTYSVKRRRVIFKVGVLTTTQDSSCSENDTQTVGNDLEFWWTMKRFAFYLLWSVWKRISKWYTDRLESVCLLFRGNMAVMPHSYELNFRSDSQPTDGLTQTVHHIADQCICLGKENKIFNSKLIIIRLPILLNTKVRLMK